MQNKNHWHTNFTRQFHIHSHATSFLGPCKKWPLPCHQHFRLETFWTCVDFRIPPTSAHLQQNGIFLGNLLPFLLLHQPRSGILKNYSHWLCRVTLCCGSYASEKNEHTQNCWIKKSRMVYTYQVWHEPVNKGGQLESMFQRKVLTHHLDSGVDQLIDLLFRYRATFQVGQEVKIWQSGHCVIR